MDLRTARFIRGMKQSDLESLTGIDEVRISRYEKGLVILHDHEKQEIERVLNPMDHDFNLIKQSWGDLSKRGRLES